MRKIFFSLSTLLCSLTAGAQTSQEMVEYLASDALKGRFPGTNGDSLSVVYIQQQYQKAGLLAAFPDYKQGFDIKIAQEVKGDNYMTFSDKALQLHKTFVPLPFSADRAISGQTIFAGYGLESKDGEFDDYRGQAVKDKIVVIYKGLPKDLPIKMSLMALRNDRNKVLLAQDKGAKAVILVDPHADSLKPFDAYAREFALDIPVVEVLAKDVQPLLSIEKSIAANLKVDLQDINTHTYNVVGYIPGSDPALAHEVIVVGAHYDHLGMGGPGTSSRAPGQIAVHAGADDNASGVATVLTLAQRLKAQAPRRTVMFASFGAEERGLIGSKFMANHLPQVAGAKTEYVGMFNFDMVGNLRKQAIQIGGVGTSLESDSLVHLANQEHQFKITTSPSGHGPSDHASFYAKGMPVFYFTTGITMDYHTPQDRPEKLNYTGMDSVINYVEDLLISVANQPHRLTFKQSGAPVATSGHMKRSKLKVTLGLMPDVTGAETKGMRIDLVVPEKPAAKAGLRAGDVIFELNGMKINSIEDYMTRLGVLQPNTTVPVKVRRDQKELTIQVKL